MKSGVFLLLYTLFNAILLGSCAIYIAATRELGKEEDNALVLPQILAVIPGGEQEIPLKIKFLGYIQYYFIFQVVFSRWPGRFSSQTSGPGLFTSPFGHLLR